MRTFVLITELFDTPKGIVELFALDPMYEQSEST